MKGGYFCGKPGDLPNMVIIEVNGPVAVISDKNGKGLMRVEDTPKDSGNWVVYTGTLRPLGSLRGTRVTNASGTEVASIEPGTVDPNAVVAVKDGQPLVAVSGPGSQLHRHLIAAAFTLQA